MWTPVVDAIDSCPPATSEALSRPAQQQDEVVVGEERERWRITLPSGAQIDMASVDYVNVACDRLHLRGEEQGWLTFDAALAAARKVVGE
jgi:hypothetical protein